MIEKAFLEECLANGMSLPEIGRIAERPVGTVGYWVKRHGLTANGSTKFRPGKGLRRKVLEPLLVEGLTLSQIAERLSVSIQTVCYWIEKYGLPKPREVRAGDSVERVLNGDTRATRRCRHHGDVEFVLDKRGSWRCRKCRQDAVVERRRKVKRLLVEEAGGSCVLCGYARTPAALQFHHLDPSAKRFNISQNGHSIGIAKARDEASKCVLLCANCHVEVERGIAQLPDPTSV